jgi:hypothetical protein
LAYLIKQIHDLVDLAIDQGITTYWTRTQIDDAVDAGQMTLFRQILKEFPKTKIIRNEILPFQNATNVTVTGSIGSLPSDFEHEIEAYVATGSIKYPVKFIDQGFFRRRVLDPVDPPVATNVFGMINYNSGRKIELSSQVTPLVLTYFKRPTKPVYGTTLSSGQYIYNQSGSTDLDWSNTLYDLLVEKTLPYLGLGMKDGQIINATNNPMPKEVSAL